MQVHSTKILPLPEHIAEDIEQKKVKFSIEEENPKQQENDKLNIEEKSKS